VLPVEDILDIDLQPQLFRERQICGGIGARVAGSMTVLSIVANMPDRWSTPRAALTPG
jgi:hypothetical protein